MDRWDVFGVLLGLFLIGSGFHGVANRKHRSLGYLIISVAQIVYGVFGLIAVVLFILKGTK
jgi:VIT1/CCC1 family predicted Fe2+/Mn2+ transporter